MGLARFGIALGGAFGILLVVAALAAPALGEERPTETRVDLFDKSGARAGSAIVDERTGRVDLFDARSNRVGSGAIDKNGRLDTYDLRGNRTGWGSPLTPAPRRANGGRK